MAEFINTIDLLGDDVVVKALVEKTISEFNDDVVTSVGTYAFYNCSSLTSVDLPNATSVGAYAFESCSALTSIDIPNVTEIGNNAFYRCSSLTSIDLPNVKSIGNTAFSYCSNLASIDIPNVTSIGNSAFESCSSLTSVDLPNVTSIGTYAFGGCKALTSIILRKSQVCSLKNTSAFDNTPFASNGKGGTVYVLQALITEYQNATNWSTLYASGKCNFVAIEGSEYE